MSMRNRGNVVDEVDAPEATVPEPSAPEADDSEREDVSGQPVTEAPEIINLNGFWEAVGSINPDEPNYDGVKAEYDKLSKGGKQKATREISARVMQSVENGDSVTALKLAKTKRFFSELKPASSATPADPTVELVNRIAALRLANTQLSTEELEERVNGAVEAPNEIVQALVTKLVEVRAGRKPRVEGGKRHNVKNHIEQVFAGQESGTWLDTKAISEANSEEYGGPANLPSVETNLKSGKFSAQGLTVETRDGKLGVVKS